MPSGPGVTASGLGIGVDIGGSKIVAGVVDADGVVLDLQRRTTPDRSTAPRVVEDVICEVVAGLLARHGSAAVGVGAAGFVDATRELVMFAPHLSWRGEPLAARLRERLAVPVLVDNDANTALWAEHRHGAARGAENAVMITLGTGIGGSLLVGGRPYRGHNGMAGEFGHMQVVPDGRPCECGKTGCWEQYCSGKALARFAREAGSPLTGLALGEAALCGDPVARGAFGEVGRWLGVGTANVVAAFDPEIVVIGGGVSEAGAALLDPAKAALGSSLVGMGYRTEPELVVAELGPMAGLVGAADLARLRFGDPQPV